MVPIVPMSRSSSSNNGIDVEALVLAEEHTLEELERLEEERGALLQRKLKPRRRFTLILFLVYGALGLPYLLLPYETLAKFDNRWPFIYLMMALLVVLGGSVLNTIGWLNAKEHHERTFGYAKRLRMVRMKNEEEAAKKA